MNSLDAGYRSLACAVIIRAVRDVRERYQADEARAFLTSPECKALARLALIVAGQARPSASETASTTALPGYERAEASMADLPTALAGEIAEATAQPAPAVQAQGHETYCLWPGDTLSLCRGCWTI